jgi:preprotein translocase subunit SecB
MTEPSCQLEDYHFRRLAIEWHEPRESGQVDVGYVFDYEVGRHRTERNRYRLTFRMTAKSGTPSPIGYSVDAEIVGFFQFLPDTPHEKMEQLIRLNGSAVLYGILRGQIASLTGVFPYRKMILPTFMMRDIVEGIENAKKARKEKKATKAATAKRKKPVER